MKNREIKNKKVMAEGRAQHANCICLHLIAVFVLGFELLALGFGLPAFHVSRLPFHVSRPSEFLFS
jgi:hypothetical protein